MPMDRSPIAIVDYDPAVIMVVLKINQGIQLYEDYEESGGGKRGKEQKSKKKRWDEADPT